MSDDMDIQAAYWALREQSPELFQNAEANGIDILFDAEMIARAEACADAKVEAGAPAFWRRHGIMYRDAYVTIVKDAVKYPDGSIGTYTRVLLSRDRQRVAVVFPMRDGKCVLMREYRHSIRGFNWGIPRGMPENDATLEEDARREVEEEIGAQVVALEYLGVLQPEAGFASYSCALFLAEVTGELKGQTSEAIGEIIEVTPAELAAMIARDEVTDTYVLSAFAKLVAAGKLKL